MKTKGSLLLIVLMTVLLFACNQPNTTVNEENIFSEEAIAIEVVELSTGEIHEEITDDTFLHDLSDKLEQADITSTEGMEITPPEFSLIFINEENQPFFEIGYYLEETTYDGAIGRYHLLGEDEFYHVTTELPVEVEPTIEEE